jgi:GNAT superfamily N-acetyltransferase
MKTATGRGRDPLAAGPGASPGSSSAGIGAPAADSVAAPDPAERRALLEVLARAFRDNPMNQAIHGPSPHRRLRANRAGLRALVLDSHGQEGDGVHTRVSKGSRGEILGGFIALAPGRQALPSPRLHRQIGCFWHQGIRAMDRWSEVHFKLGQIRPTWPHWYLAVLGVAPPFWGRGVGSLLLAELLRLAGAAPDGQIGFSAGAGGGSDPIYLESDRDQSIRFYRARGFEPWTTCRVLGVRCQTLGRGFPDAGLNPCDPVRVGSREAPVVSRHPALPAGESFPRDPA